MYIYWRPAKESKNKYAVLRTTQRVDGKPTPKEIFYLGVNPAEKIKELVNEGKLTIEQALSISCSDKYPETSKALQELKNKLKEELHGKEE